MPGYVGLALGGHARPGRRARRPSPSTRSCCCPATTRWWRPPGSPGRTGSARTTSVPATCCRSPTTTRGSCRATSSATQALDAADAREHPRGRCVRSGSAASGCCRSKAATTPPSAGIAGDNGPDSPIAQAAPARAAPAASWSGSAGPLATMFGVCANGSSPSDGQVVSFDHGCGGALRRRVEQRHSHHPRRDPVSTPCRLDWEHRIDVLEIVSTIVDGWSPTVAGRRPMSCSEAGRAERAGLDLVLVPGSAASRLRRRRQYSRPSSPRPKPARQVHSHQPRSLSCSVE